MPDKRGTKYTQSELVTNGLILFEPDFIQNSEDLFRLIRDGKITVTVDYNRVGWDTKYPMDKFIFRVKTNA